MKSGDIDIDVVKTRSVVGGHLYLTLISSSSVHVTLILIKRTYHTFLCFETAKRLITLGDGFQSKIAAVQIL